MAYKYEQGLRTTPSKPVDWVKDNLENSRFKDQLEDLKVDTAKEVVGVAIKKMEDKGMKEVYLDMGASLAISLQILLNEQGENLITDGLYGGGVTAAVRRFQGKNALKIDGEAGANTLEKLVGLPATASISTLPAAPAIPIAPTTPIVIPKFNMYPKNEMMTSIDTESGIDLSISKLVRKIEIKGKDYIVIIDSSGTVQFAETDKITGKSIKGTGRKMTFEKLITNPEIGVPAEKENNIAHPSDMYNALFAKTRGNSITKYIIKDSKLIPDEDKLEVLLDNYLLKH